MMNSKRDDRCFLSLLKSIGHDRGHEIQQIVFNLVVERNREAGGLVDFEFYNELYSTFDDEADRALALYIFGIQVGGNMAVDAKQLLAQMTPNQIVRALFDRVNNMQGDQHGSSMRVNEDGSIDF